MEKLDDRLVGLREMARILDVQPSFLYGLTRIQAKGGNDFPTVRVGKYCKFRPGEVIHYFENKTKKG
jgi:hypothetical protein